MIQPALMSSAVSVWRSPPKIVEAVRDFGGGRIGLDPATDADNPCGAEAICVAPGAPQPSGIAFAVDGLAASWRGDGLVYCNPPYGREIPEWTAKARAEFDGPSEPHARWVERAGEQADVRKDELIMLLPARTDAKWWQRDVTTARAVLFLRGRIRFVGAPASAPFPSALAYWGPRAYAFRARFRHLGWIP